LTFIVKKLKGAKLKKIDYQIGVGDLRITPLAKKYVNQVLNSNRLSYGPFMEKFEREFAKLHNRKYAILVNSGTSALRIAVACLKELNNWKDGDEILVPAVTFVATANVVLDHNLKPVFVDVDPKTYNIDPNKIEEKITAKTRAIIPVHLMGLPAEMKPISKIAKKYNLKIIEDSCETMFVKYRGHPVGSFSDISCFSTYIAHLLVTGVGGFALTNNSEYAIVLKSLANHGRDSIYLHIDDDKNVDKQHLFKIVLRRFRFVRPGYSFRLTEMEAAIGLAQLQDKDQILRKRQENAKFFIKRLEPYKEYLQLPSWPSYSEHAFMLFPIVVKNPKIKKKDLVLFLEENNIETRDLMPLINQPIYLKLYGNLEKDYPVARWINENGFYIGCHQYLTDFEKNYIVAKFEEFFKKRIK